jgi:eukaryotic-like serine/threonine-protein kinase
MPEPVRRCAKCGAAYGASVTFCPLDGAPITTRASDPSGDPYLGLELGADLRIERLIGVGAMASVYAARQSGVEREVAVKILHRELVTNPVLVARFQREARAAAHLRHPHVVEVIALGTVPPRGSEPGGEPYQVLEHLDGLTLRSALLAAGGTLPAARALHVVLQICDAVGEAHEKGVVHRDLKPENAMLVRRGGDPDFVKLLDFGLSRWNDLGDSFETQAGAILGTARYLSPEGARGEPVGPPGDVYAIATILFESLAGRTPFDGDKPVAILVEQVKTPAPDVRSFPAAQGVAAPLADVLARALSKDPSSRPADARALGRTIADAARKSGLSPGELLPSPTLLGAMHGAERTRLLGSIESSSDASPPAALREALPRVPFTSTSPGERSSSFRPAGIVLACFALGALGALAIATQVGGCGGGVQ